MLELNKISILIVEDEALIAEDIREICEIAGYDVSEICYRASQALQALENQHFDLALLDINIDDAKTGIDIAKYISLHHKNTCVIFITSYSDAHTLNAAKSVFPMGYIIKPFNKEQVISTIEISMYNYARFKIPHGLNKTALEQKRNVTISDREYEILELIFEGKNNIQMAKKVFLSVNTIKFHIKNIYDKLQVNNRTQLMRLLQGN